MVGVPKCGHGWARFPTDGEQRMRKETIISAEMRPGTMTHLVLQTCPTAREDYCGICGRATTALAGAQLYVADSCDPVCKDCGRKHAPSLAALVHLATEAERVARIGRHTVFPPLTALLDLARAAENYQQCTVHGGKPVARR
jgi:hypothetical protein